MSPTIAGQALVDDLQRHRFNTTLTQGTYLFRGNDASYDAAIGIEVLALP